MASIIATPNTEEIDLYIKRCFMDAYKHKHTEYNDACWRVDYVLIRDKSNDKAPWHFYGVFNCQARNITKLARRRVRNHLQRNFGVIYEHDAGDDFSCRLRIADFIDYQVAYARFQRKQRTDHLILEVFDSNSYNYHNGLIGRVTPMIKAFWSRPEYDESCKDEYSSLPVSMLYDWDEFVRLYEETFQHKLDMYEIITSNSLIRL